MNDALDALSGSLILVLVFLVGAAVLLLATPEELLSPDLKAARRSFVPVWLQRRRRRRVERAVSNAEEAFARLQREAKGTTVEDRDTYHLALSRARGARRWLDEDNPAAAMEAARSVAFLVRHLTVEVERAKSSRRREGHR